MHIRSFPKSKNFYIFIFLGLKLYISASYEIYFVFQKYIFTFVKSQTTKNQRVMESNENKTDKYAAYRDENGRWTKGNEAHRLTAEEARKGGQVTGTDRIKRLFEMFDAKPLTAAEAVRLDAWLLTKSKDELLSILKDDRQPIVVQARAQYLLDRKTTFDATERMYDRAFGKPTQRQEIQTNEAPPVIVNYVDGGKDNNTENDGE